MGNSKRVVRVSLLCGVTLTGAALAWLALVSGPGDQSDAADDDVAAGAAARTAAVRPHGAAPEWPAGGDQAAAVGSASSGDVDAFDIAGGPADEPTDGPGPTDPMKAKVVGVFGLDQVPAERLDQVLANRVHLDDLPAELRERLLAAAPAPGSGKGAGTGGGKRAGTGGRNGKGRQGR